MAIVYVTFKIMPENADTDLSKIEERAKIKILEFGGNFAKAEQEPIGFGLSALKVIFTIPEEKGSTDKLEEDIKKVEGVMNVEVTDVRRAIG